MRHFDVIVIGCGPGGERAAIQAARAGKQVAVVERQHVLGGTRVNWGTIPSKTLRESAVFVHALERDKLEGIHCEIPNEITVHDFMHRERVVVQRELELINESLDRYRIEVFVGHARFVDAHTVAVCGPDGGVLFSMSADFIVIATGSSPNRPADVPFDGESVVDSNTILSLPRLPKTMIVLGAGVIGVEFASIFAALGIGVTLVDTRDQLLPYLDREVVAILEREIARLGITILHDDRHASVERIAGNPHRVRCTLRHAGTLEADVLLYCVGRDGNTGGIGLDVLGLVPNDYGLLAVNEHYQTAVPHVYAVGDVIGYPALASTSMEQGRQAMRHAFKIPGLTQRTEVLPFAIYAIPEVSYVGETEESLAGRGGCVRRRTRQLRHEPARPDHRRHRGDAETAVRGPLDAPAGRAHDRPRRQRADPHRTGVPASRRHCVSDRRDAVQLPDALRPLPARRAQGAARRPARRLGRGRRAALSRNR